MFSLKDKLLFAVCLLPVLASAQTQNKQLDPVTVTATIQPTTSSRTGRNLVIIKGEEIAKLPVHSLDELLRYVPGLEIQARGPMGAQSDFVVRGGTFQQVLVIIDGMRVNDPNTGHFNSYIPVTPGEIERIEVLKGASSAIYGSEAVGGVIHIITKAFATNSGKAQQSYNASLTGGAYGLVNGSGSAYYNNGKTAISAGVLSNNADGQPQRGTNGFLHLNTFSLSASHQINENWQVAARSSYDTRNFAAQGFYTTFASDTASENVNTLWNQVQISYEKGRDRFSFRAGYKTVDDTYKYNPSSSANLSTSKLWQILSTYEHGVTQRGSMIVGVQYQNKSIASNDRGNHTLNQAAAFVGWNQTIGEHFTLNPALRLDWNEGGGYELVPQMNVSYRQEWFQLRASAGKTIRDADFTERYNNYNKPTVASGRIGNPNLTAEHSFSYEGGADFFIGQHIKISTSVFRRQQSDLIDWVTTPYANMPRKDNLVAGGTYALAKNISKVNTTGFEGDIQYIHPLANKHKIVLNAGVVWMDTESSEGVTSFYISSHARVLTNFSAEYQAPRWNVSINGLYKKRNPQSAAAIKAYVSDDYFVSNVKASYFIIKDRLSIFGEVDNIFDRNYQDLLGAQMPGRWVMGGARFSFSK
ncbi:iron complex outermembrane receptor protein [Chitinophaga skermanii]|uniref:Iron complex outermembrane receptor protein n=1 Tax=Chitinophaga skermanii TaxID=331697 RepID=A0A327QRD8_9BACT|nr:TonB-dependent receptor [Chitinophaga skermanii]RAJ06598.1 iron complex outermembrane receptor protein [Chitinophaga skermanii]